MLVLPPFFTIAVVLLRSEDAITLACAKAAKNIELMRRILLLQTPPISSLTSSVQVMFYLFIILVYIPIEREGRKKNRRRRAVIKAGSEGGVVIAGASMLRGVGRQIRLHKTTRLGFLVGGIEKQQILN